MPDVYDYYIDVVLSEFLDYFGDMIFVVVKTVEDLRLAVSANG